MLRVLRVKVRLVKGMLVQFSGDFRPAGRSAENSENYYFLGPNVFVNI